VKLQRNLIGGFQLVDNFLIRNTKIALKVKSQGQMSSEFNHF